MGGGGFFPFILKSRLLILNPKMPIKSKIFISKQNQKVTSCWCCLHYPSIGGPKKHGQIGSLNPDPRINFTPVALGLRPGWYLRILLINIRGGTKIRPDRPGSSGYPPSNKIPSLRPLNGTSTMCVYRRYIPPAPIHSASHICMVLTATHM